jgi:hypothetical protein
MVYVLHFKCTWSTNKVKERCIMEFLLLAKVGMVIEGIVRAGYVLAGSYFLKTGAIYVRDYKDSIEKEKAEVK